ncbi:MAG: hypothetical protein DI594_15690 [Shewanella oneidensis]|nr:MAG: hypothetical protein DI594_15690 [Shewanella oneidensis]
MDSGIGIKTFVMEIYWQQRAYAIYQCRSRSGYCIPNSITIECLDGGGEFTGLRFSDISDAICVIELMGKL